MSENTPTLITRVSCRDLEYLIFTGIHGVRGYIYRVLWTMNICGDVCLFIYSFLDKAKRLIFIYKSTNVLCKYIIR